MNFKMMRQKDSHRSKSSNNMMRSSQNSARFTELRELNQDEQTLLSDYIGLNNARLKRKPLFVSALESARNHIKTSRKSKLFIHAKELTPICRRKI